MKIYVVVIQHEYGTGISTHSTMEKAQRHVVDYVNKWWVDEVGGDPPSDPRDMVDAYFELVEREYYEIEVTNLDGAQ